MQTLMGGWNTDAGSLLQCINHFQHHVPRCKCFMNLVTLVLFFVVGLRAVFSVLGPLCADRNCLDGALKYIFSSPPSKRVIFSSYASPLRFSNAVLDISVFPVTPSLYLDY